MNRAQYRVLHQRRHAQAQAVAEPIRAALGGDVEVLGGVDWRDTTYVKVIDTRPGLVEWLRTRGFTRVEDRGVCTIAWM